MVGYGSIGKRHVQNLSKIPNIEIIVCTKQIINQRYPKKIKIIDSIEKSFVENPDVCFITNITTLHISTAIKFAERGVNLFIEKPLSNSSNQINQLVNLIKKKKLITQLGCQLRFHDGIKTIKKLISNGRIGKILSAHVECGSYLPDWHPHEDYKRGYSAMDELGGGVILTCIHEIDYLYWFFGDVEKVFSMSGRYSDLDISADDLSAIIMKFKNNVIAEVHLDYFQRPEFRSCKIIGTNGTIYWDSDTNIVKLYNIKQGKWKNMLKISNYERNTIFKREIKHFLYCLKKKKFTINPVEKDGVKTLKIALAAIKSAKTDRVVRL